MSDGLCDYNRRELTLVLFTYDGISAEFRLDLPILIARDPDAVKDFTEASISAIVQAAKGVARDQIEYKLP